MSLTDFIHQKPRVFVIARRAASPTWQSMKNGLPRPPLLKLWWARNDAEKNMLDVKVKYGKRLENTRAWVNILKIKLIFI